MPPQVQEAGTSMDPTPHDLRRAFALNMRRNNADIYSLRWLIGHADLSILRGYLAQTAEDIQSARDKASPMENYSWDWASFSGWQISHWRRS